jgi:hypothetical protein
MAPRLRGSAATPPASPNIRSPRSVKAEPTAPTFR